MNRAAAALLALPLLALAACGTGGTDSTAALPEADFFDMAHELSSFADVPDDGLTRIGEAICQTWDNTVADDLDPTDNWMGNLSALLDGGYDAKDSGSFMIYAVSTYCPEHTEIASVSQ